MDQIPDNEKALLIFKTSRNIQYTIICFDWVVWALKYP